MKTAGIIAISLLAVAGGIAAAAYITKKRLERENEEDYFDGWDDGDFDDDWDFDFDEEGEDDESAPAKEIKSVIPEDAFAEEAEGDDSDEEL